MKLKKYHPKLPPPLRISQQGISWFVSYSPLSSERYFPSYPLRPSEYQKAITQDRKIYAHLRQLIKQREKSSQQQHSNSTLALIFNIEKRFPTRLNSITYPGWFFSKNNESIHRIQCTPRPTYDQVIFLLSQPIHIIINYLNLNTYALHHPQELYSLEKLS